MRDERLGERAAVARLQDRRLDLDEAPLVEDPRGSSRPCASGRARRRATPRSSAGRGSAGGSAARRRSARGRCRGAACGCARAARASRRGATARRGATSPASPSTPTMSPRWTSTSPVRSTGHSSWMRPERSTRSRKTSFPMSRRAITRPASRRFVSGGRAVVERLRLGADGGDLVAVGEALRRGHRGRV